MLFKDIKEVIFIDPFNAFMFINQSLLWHCFISLKTINFWNNYRQSVLFQWHVILRCWCIWRLAIEVQGTCAQLLNSHSLYVSCSFSHHHACVIWSEISFLCKFSCKCYLHANIYSGYTNVSLSSNLISSVI